MVNARYDQEFNEKKKERKKERGQQKKAKTRHLLLDNLQRKPSPKYPQLKESWETMLENLKPTAKLSRKPGSTIATDQDSEQKFRETKNATALGWGDKLHRPKSTIKEWIQENQKKHGFDTGKPEHQVKESMIWSQMRRDRMQSNGRGQLDEKIVEDDCC